MKSIDKRYYTYAHKMGWLDELCKDMNQMVIGKSVAFMLQHFRITMPM